MKRSLVIVLIPLVFFTSAQEQHTSKVLEADEIEYFIFGCYSDVPTKINTTIMLKLTKTHLLRSPNGFFNPFLDIPCDTLTHDFFKRAELLKKNIPACLSDSTGQVFGEEITSPLKRSVYVEFKRKGKKHSAYIHFTSNGITEEIKVFYSSVMALLNS